MPPHPRPEDDAEHATSIDPLAALMKAVRPGRVVDQALPLDGARLAGGRVEVLHKLGSGAMGTVYAALDRAAPVALKTLNHLSANQIYRLKNEFRTLAQLTHRNVVAVHELFAEHDAWFFTMEMVCGLPLDQFWVERFAPPDRRYGREAYEVLRDLFAQVVHGVDAIHQAGLLHRDLKPTNALVEPTGRVVILDFGLVSDQLPGGIGQTVEFAVSGTPGFMAPEQAAGRPAEPASDWYAVGTMLYLLLTGRLPHTGNMLSVLHDKQQRDAPRASVLVPHLPQDLDDICVRLLQRDPAARPSVEEMLAVFEPVPRSERVQAPQAIPWKAEFVGRGDTLARLEQAFEQGASRPQLILLGAESGMGKTALLAQFVENVQRRHDPFVLRGRCFEREAVPYKAFDQIVDDLTRVLLRLPDQQVLPLLPRHTEMLTRLFPVLLRVDAFRRAASADVPSGEPRKLGFAAMRELLARVHDRRRVLLIIDDLQWADMDSVRMLSEVLAMPDSPSLTIVASHRTEDQRIPVLRELAELENVRMVSLTLGPLTGAEARALALQGLAEQLPERERVAERIVAESHGSPLYVLELARAAQSEPTDRHASLPQILQHRVAQLPDDARLMLELVAVSGRPLPRQAFAGQLDANAYPAALSMLRAAKLVQTAGPQQGELVEAYHDRVRLAVIDMLSAEQLAAHHRVLARALESIEDADPEWIAQHLERSGQPERAYEFVLRAAERAALAFAYGREADLLTLALSLTTDRSARSALQRRLGDALARAGRGVDAGHAYVRAVPGATEQQALELRTLAASQWLRAGHVVEAVSLLRELLRAEGLYWPESTGEALLRFLANRARIRLLGLRHRARREDEVPVELLRKLDILYPAQTALGTFDYLRGAYFGSVALPLALKAGEPRRLINAIGAEAVYASLVDGMGASKRAAQILEQMAQLADDMPEADGSALEQLTAALCAYWSGQWSKVVPLADRSEAIFERHVAGAKWEATLGRSIRTTVRIHSGGLPAMVAGLSSALLDAAERDDRYAQLEAMRTGFVVCLCEDRASDAEEQLSEIESQLDRFPLVSIAQLVMSAAVSLRLYLGDTARAERELEQRWERCRKLGMHRTPLMRVFYQGMRTDWLRLAGGRRHADALAKLAQEVGKEPIAWAPALSLYAQAQAAKLYGERGQAARLLQRASEAYDACALSLDAALARLEQSELVVARRAEELRDGALTFLRQQGIVRPEGWLRMVHAQY